ncbi:putative dehydrogenase [Streptosporangium album]|uniref:Putative dehydrogenase n=1 Tax=Streptosporangium album TaxID=47479 RepID=A0A7W7S2K3_9ACTN|nr:Gfo/Idh/MocA family oxidoreductase [Streptosporangium album]MBB4942620.1 putative dehydrogenase [Streptosporangium album]
MRIAIAGLATSHPYTDARTLASHADLMVWEEDQARLARFVEEHPTAEVAAGLDDLLAARPDGVVLTVPNPEVASALAPVLAADLPCFVNKPAAATAAQLAAVDALASARPELVLSTSVLRFAPAFTALGAEDLGEVLSVRATVRHDVGLWAGGHNPWQDDPAVGGGTMVTMGVHGVELLVALLGPAVRLAGAAAATRSYTALKSEDTGVMALAWDSGVVGAVEVVGVTDEESYTVSVHTRAGTREAVVEPGSDPLFGLGYRGVVEAFLAMVGGAPSPVPWEQTRAVLGTLVAAREACA